ncbi:hypothetical protein N2603_19390 [Bradyrhizobium huanghuaihaiense]|uniref:hypothetical protein n=1 Tax=Bradyrhizobium huanghuaihaiense TaxID=990078 RepID=UPI0021AA8085|nr:hypothetical protein [Bradyrhizobium sp. CB3035]UWU80546.1 hypothetical protein N2603_19390 [Bradyrhizobium sp. CB3035]
MVLLLGMCSAATERRIGPAREECFTRPRSVDYLAGQKHADMGRELTPDEVMADVGDNRGPQPGSSRAWNRKPHLKVGHTGSI